MASDVEIQKSHPSVSAKVVKKILQPFTQKKLGLPLLIFFTDAVLYLSCVAGSVSASSHGLRLLFSLVAGLAVGMLFIVGHDACHGSLTRFPWLNELVGRLAFLPSLTPFSLWNLGHNRIHHRYTNLKASDYVWRPFSKPEFDALPRWRKLAERFYRTLAGQGLYYFVEIWWRKLLFPNHQNVHERKRLFILDNCLVVVFAVMQLAFVVWLGWAAHSSWFASIVFGLLIPFAVWNWLMGFVIFQHHTHPSLAWFETEEEWNYWENQIEGTTHIQFPRPMGWLLHNIMEHTAHHAMTGIPLYRLKEAQKALESGFHGRVKIIRWTWNGYLAALLQCKLYDYEKHVWLDFAGNETTARTISGIAHSTASSQYEPKVVSGSQPPAPRAFPRALQPHPAP